MRTYNQYMTEGHRLLDVDRVIPAYNYFKAAAGFATKDNTTKYAPAFHMMGICNRLDGAFLGALQDFDVAYHMARSDRNLLLQCMIMRDQSMVRHDMGNFRGAAYDAEHSIELARQAQAPDEEMGACIGFLARHNAALGNLQAAEQFYQAAHKLLRAGNNRHYELNNLVWLIKSTNARFRLLPQFSLRAIWLAVRSRRFRKLGEVILGLIGPQAYESIRSLYFKLRSPLKK